MRLALVTLFTCLSYSCKDSPDKTKGMEIMPEEMEVAEISRYPEALEKVFDAHGGLSAWKDKRTLIFEIVKPAGNEKHTIDLLSRDEKIEMPDVTMGSDRGDVWLLDDKKVYQGDAVFYHNLMFYFYAMPFVVADKGVKYSEAEVLDFEGISYPGIRISYDNGVGVSSKDEYFIHYNPKTFLMEWLGYTVTYGTKEASDNVRWIRYNDLMSVEGLQLPKSLTWYTYEGRKLLKGKKPLAFKNVRLSESSMSKEFYRQPQGALLVEVKAAK